MAWKKIILSGDEEHAVVIGRAGTPPAATNNDCADFYVVMPFAMTLRRLKASMKDLPSSNTTFQVRLSTDNGGTFSNAFGNVTVNTTVRVGTADPADLNTNEGDVMNFSVTAGGGSGNNAAVFLIGVRR